MFPYNHLLWLRHHYWPRYLRQQRQLEKASLLFFRENVVWSTIVDWERTFVQKMLSVWSMLHDNAPVASSHYLSRCHLLRISNIYSLCVITASSPSCNIMECASIPDQSHIMVSIMMDLLLCSLNQIFWPPLIVSIHSGYCHWGLTS